MNQRVGVVVCFSLLAACAADDNTEGSGDTTPPDPAARFIRVPAGTQGSHLPPSMANADVVVMLEMVGDPVTVVSSTLPVPMTRGQKQQLKQSLAHLQGGAVAGARALGAQ